MGTGTTATSDSNRSSLVGGMIPKQAQMTPAPAVSQKLTGLNSGK